jgi:hypothetical protein
VGTSDGVGAGGGARRPWRRFSHPHLINGSWDWDARHYMCGGV